MCGFVRSNTPNDQAPFFRLIKTTCSNRTFSEKTAPSVSSNSTQQHLQPKSATSNLPGQTAQHRLPLIFCFFFIKKKENYKF
jgi:hypothetical protein